MTWKRLHMSRLPKTYSWCFFPETLDISGVKTTINNTGSEKCVFLISHCENIYISVCVNLILHSRLALLSCDSPIRHCEGMVVRLHGDLYTLGLVFDILLLSICHNYPIVVCLHDGIIEVWVLEGLKTIQNYNYYSIVFIFANERLQWNTQQCSYFFYMEWLLLYLNKC